MASFWLGLSSRLTLWLNSHIQHVSTYKINLQILLFPWHRWCFNPQLRWVKSRILGAHSPSLWSNCQKHVLFETRMYSKTIGVKHRFLHAVLKYRPIFLEFLEERCVHVVMCLQGFCLFAKRKYRPFSTNQNHPNVGSPTKMSCNSCKSLVTYPNIQLLAVSSPSLYCIKNIPSINQDKLHQFIILKRSALSGWLPQS